MKASALLENVREDYVQDLAGTDNGTSRWSPASLLRRLNEAHREAVYRGLLIRDSSTPRICSITLEAGKAEYRLDQRIIKVNSIELVWPDGRGVNLPAMSAGGMVSTIGPNWRTETGLPLAYYPEGHTIRLARIPTLEFDGLTLNVDCYRYPLATLVAGYVGALAATANAGATQITLKDASVLPDIGLDEEVHLTGSAGTIVATGKDGNTLQCLPLAVDWAINSTVTADNEPEIPSSQHPKLLFYVVGMAYLKEDPDVKGSVGYHDTYMTKFTNAFGREIDHSQRMHNLQSVNSLRFSGIPYPRFNSGWVHRGMVG